jgi:mRNA-degrading endonuclease RelE of RelBE toxin-antitoxin system
MHVVTLSPAAQRQIEKLDRSIRLRILAHLRGLGDNPRPTGAIKLEGQNAYRIRVGD